MECAVELTHNWLSAASLDQIWKLLGEQQQKCLLLVGLFTSNPFTTFSGFNTQALMLGQYYHLCYLYVIQ